MPFLELLNLKIPKYFLVKSDDMKIIDLYWQTLSLVQQDSWPRWKRQQARIIVTVMPTLNDQAKVPKAMLFPSISEWRLTTQFFLAKVRTFWETQNFKKNLPHGFDKSANLLSHRQNHEEDFLKSCLLLRKSELYQHTSYWQ